MAFRYCAPVLAAAVALLLSSSVEVRVEDARGVSTEEARAIAEGLQSAIAQRSQREVSVVGKSPCGQTPACLGELTKSGATDFVFVRLIGVPTRIRLIAERSGALEARSEADLTRARASWPVVFGGVAEHLFPDRPPPIAVEPPPSSPPPPIAPPPPLPPVEEQASYAPWLLAGAGVAVLAVGVGFGVSSRGARSSAASEPHTEQELAGLEDRAIGHGITANVMFGLGGAGVLGGLVWMLVE